MRKLFDKWKKPIAALLALMICIWLISGEAYAASAVSADAAENVYTGSLPVSEDTDEDTFSESSSESGDAEEDGSSGSSEDVSDSSASESDGEDEQDTSSAEEDEDPEDDSAEDAYGKAEISEIDADGYAVIEVTNEELTEASDASLLIRARLTQAAEEATEELPYKIIIEPGTYELAYCLYISSNTYLYAEGVTFIQTAGADKTMLKVGANGSEAAGYEEENIIIEGGTWDKNGNAKTLLKIGHAQNVTVKNAVFTNCRNAHLSEIAGVKDLTISDCTFSDQILDAEASLMTYEAIQLDILESSHIGGYRAEDLPLENITITGCTFDNVPRGIGAHTAVLNSPIDTLAITDNTFTNIGSCAVQLMNVKNCTISGNTMENVPRGIYIYTYRTHGVFLSTTLEAEGGITSDTSTSYETPADVNLVITENTITMEGSDDYADYVHCAVYLCGLDVSSAYTPVSGDEIPAGNYYLEGVTVSDNTITAPCHGIRLNNVRDASITGNTLTYTGTESYYGISLCAGAEDGTIQNNDVSGFKRGVSLTGSSASPMISENSVAGGGYGIYISGSTASYIRSNMIEDTACSSICLNSGASSDAVESNTAAGSESNGIYINSCAQVSEITSNSIDSAGNNGIYINSGAQVSEITLNSVSNAGNRGICLNSLAHVSAVKSNEISGSGNIGISLLSSSEADEITSNTVSSTGGSGITLSSSAAAAVITSNTIDSAGGNGISLSSSAKADDITSNTIDSAGGNGISLSSSAEVTNITSNMISKSGSSGIYLGSYTEAAYIKSNTISTAEDCGIWIYASANAANITSNTVSDVGEYGVLVSGSACAANLNSNKISSSSWSGICISNAAVTNVKNNTISKPKTNGIYICSGSKVSAVSSNTVTGASKQGIRVGSIKKSLTVSGNTISGSGGYQIYCGTGTTGYTAAIKSNTITGKNKAKAGIYVNSGKVTIQSNTIKSCSYPVILTTKAYGTIYKNTLSSNSSNKYKVGSKTCGNLSAPSITIGTKTKNSIRLSWKKNSSAAGYRIYRSKSGSGTYSRITTISKNSTISYTDKGLSKNTTYYYKMRAYRKIGNTTIYSPYSSVKSAKTKAE